MKKKLRIQCRPLCRSFGGHRVVCLAFSMSCLHLAFCLDNRHYIRIPEQRTLDPEFEELGAVRDCSLTSRSYNLIGIVCMLLRTGIIFSFPSKKTVAFK